MKNYWQTARAVRVLPYDPTWKEAFEKEEKRLNRIFGKTARGIHHIGSTSVEGLNAKPIIDILIEVANMENADRCTEEMGMAGYTAKGENGIPGRRYFYKGEGNERSHHVHVFEEGSDQVITHLAFRDYLRKHPEEKRRYAALKEQLAVAYPKDIDSYIQGKTNFVEELTQKALSWAKEQSRHAN
ncbi:hypothetical protein CR205_18440 [Alteribacter lacisalsi]|uniref:GrpB family protein n=1 Tax=Alteribacter lacisalsi TaxID=2045244 RepID=A0A2W0HEG0_9BACI|nr:GrpB family protein [Alteribacter lacisalsi]PYZ95695.1 hypothetical protein CR205_18440 [Alteribacter lacisalsi]